MQIFASPGTKFDVEKQKDREILKRVVAEELSMNPDKMKSIITEHNIKFEESDNRMIFEINGYNVFIVYDTNADRMRIVSPIAKIADVTEEQIKKAMEANFHTALDAKYAISNGIVWSIFVHPLSDLSEKLFISAIDQTVVAAATFGKEYSSGSLSFPKIKERKVNDSEDTPDEESKINDN